MTIGSAVLTQFSSVTERRTNGEIDGQTGVPTMAKAALAEYCAATPSLWLA